MAPRSPRPDDPADAAGAAPSWAADETHAAPASADSAQMPLFHGDGLARVRRSRLRARIKALLAKRLKRKVRPPATGEPSRPPSSWPDSFFDGQGHA